MNEALLTRFYAAIARRDYAAVNACYHSECTFHDPVFPHLKGKQVLAMWHMLCEGGKDLAVTSSNIHAGNDTGQGHWEARYTFSQTGRKVVNKIDSRFTFRDGLILHHTDSFDLWQWAGMALGASGWMLGWAPPVRGKIRAMAGKALQRFIAQHPIYQ
jgi:ketosteroid isomerase-like protein